MKENLGNLSGDDKGSAVRIIKTHEKRIELFRHYNNPVGLWQVNTVFYTEHAEKVELSSHKLLESYLDDKAPIGEVFCCSVSEAADAIEFVLRQMGLFELARKKVINNNVSREYGTCIICGGCLTERGSCPDCIHRHWL